MVYINDIYHLRFFMTKTTAKLFMHGRSQAVRLPKEFRMPGTEVEISRDGDMVTLRPSKPQKPDWRKAFAEMDALGPLDGFLEDRYQGLIPPRDVDLD
jgi:antitoxin VapB